MRLFVVHDEAGNIDQAVRIPSDSPLLIPTPPAGYFHTECEPPEGMTEDSDLLAFVNSYRLDSSRPKVTPVRRTDQCRMNAA